MWNPFKKNDDDDDDAKGQKMGMLQRIAMKKMANMSDAERKNMMQEAFKPENKGKIMAMMQQMQKSGQISEEQIRLAKEKLGL